MWWGAHPLGPSEAALAALTSDASVRVTQTDDGWEFAPASGAEPTAAVVYYPGGHVDARSYAPYARDIAAQGYLVVIPVMPLSLAVLSPDAADKVVAAHPGVSRWVIGGHSLGGAMAGQYVGKHPGAMDGLVLLGAYVPEGNDLQSSSVDVLTQVGTLDTVVNRENLAAGLELLPPDATFVELDGGNHAQFGDYGPQPGDDPNPTMSAADQRRRAVDGTVEVLRGAQPTP
jgi:dienelactone hydrolase